MLIAKRNALLNEAKQEIQKYVSGENRQLVDTAIDEADWAAVEISEFINLERLSAQRQLLNDVNECLRKLNEAPTVSARTVEKRSARSGCVSFRRQHSALTARSRERRWQFWNRKQKYSNPEYVLLMIAQRYLPYQTGGQWFNQMNRQA